MEAVQAGKNIATVWWWKLGVIAIVWSLLVGASLSWNLKQVENAALATATAAAQSAINKDISFRKWGASHGGVYVPVTGHTPPNPYLRLPGQEVVTTTGIKLTLMNPAYMLRQMQQDFPGEYGARSRITSLKPVNPNNAPDAWEAKALRGFETARKERVELQEIDGKSYVRVLRPFVVVDECLKCHEQNGYRLGEIRGGIGADVPMAPFTANESERIISLDVSHGVIWLIGLLGIGFWHRRDRAQNLLRLKTLCDLRENEQKYHLVADYTTDWEYWVGTAGEIVYMSPSCKERTGYDVAEFTADPGLLEAIVHPDDRGLYQSHYKIHYHQHAAGEAEFRIVRKDGEIRWINHSCRPVFDRSGAYRGTRAGNRDVTLRRQAEAEASKLNRLYRVLSSINELIVHRPEPELLYQAACDIAVKDGGFVIAWVAMMDDDGHISPLACSGVSMDSLQELITQLAGYEGESAVSSTLREKRTSVIHNLPETQFMAPWLDKILAHQLGSAASIPIDVKGQKHAAFTLYSHEIGFFDRSEVALLEELAKDISYALEVAEIDAAQEKAREQLRLSASVFESSSEGVVVTDAQENILMVNRAFTALTGYAAEEVLGLTPKILRSERHDRAFYTAMWASIHEIGRWQGEIWNRRKDGEVYPELLSISAVKDDSGQLTHYVAVFTDISHLKESEARLDYLARHDPLTGLPNRMMLTARLEYALDHASRERKRLGLLLLDFDRFKDVNDSFGHAVGDELLQQAAARLTARLRNADTISRLGGDEFTVLLEDLGHPQDAARVSDELIAAMNEPFVLSNGIEVRVGTSIGIALYPDHGGTEQELLQQADAALYRAKAEGRGRFKYFSEELTRGARERIALEARLRRAIAQNELRVHYQPQVEIKSGRITGAEALVRWQHPEEGLIPPVRFIPVAEETGLIDAIGTWVLRETCRQGKAWLDAGMAPVTLAVNVSPYQIRHGDIAAMTAKILAETGYPAEWLELELTESALMEREGEAVEILQRIRALGVRLALDDFGTGYSSLAYLKRFPLDVLKIDKSFVDDIPHLRDDMEIAATIVAMGHTLRFKVLAEGVETEEQLAFLVSQGCDYYQGYLKSRPVPAEDFLKWLVPLSSR
ncbi:hypothetical protein SKTS_25950 [Sulfurimicrobium lacus]|uniref:GGDEF domain-containing protein n=1 Tax=Sulfurimicrobium lacus TaxID=2715678 RepID=A0A6F8VG58_9PROT|nr:EAL domain-containing protein [Sulfurimicrobium lacus]BCB27709.1 hypothetical protein SKTS_25950 [Sulfurimicrobium lacus]